MGSTEWSGPRGNPLNKMRVVAKTLAAFFILFSVTGTDAQKYYGKRIGQLSQLQHSVKGEVYAVDSRTIHIKGFSYDGTAPDAFFYAGRSGSPSENGVIIPDENGRRDPLGAYSNRDVTITLPDGMTLKDVAWLSVWCRAFSIDFGSLKIPRALEYPRPQKIDGFPTLEHAVKSDKIVVVDAQTFLIPDFHYDGEAPDAFFWVGRGTKPGSNGIAVPDENGGREPIRRYSGKTIVITLPDSMTVFDIDYLGVWCKSFSANFGHVIIPKGLNIPPSLKMLGVAPQTKLNCEVLHDELAFEVRWAVAGDSIVMQLVGRVDDGEYMSFGLSGSDTKSVMVGGDVTAAWLDQISGRGEAKDYYLGAQSQCQGGQGACPDEKLRSGRNNVRLLNAAYINDFTMLTFQRPLRGADANDKDITPNFEQAVIWAIGPVNSQGDTAYHRLRQNGDVFIDFGRSPFWNCPYPDEQESRTTSSNSRVPGANSRTHSSNSRTPNANSRTPSANSRTSNTRTRTSSSRLPASSAAASEPAVQPWHIPPIPCYEPEDGVFYAQIGPTGGKSGYNAITGKVGWGISWYINGLLIPEVNVVRGKTYTFVVEGGSDPNVPAQYHPFYITDDSEGGYEHKTQAERDRIEVFAGVEVDADGYSYPTAYGRLCEWKANPDSPANTFKSFGAYQRTLNLDCQEGQPGILQWTPDVNTPDQVYYQCYTHRNLGWKINVVDRCNNRGGSNVGASRADYDYYDDDPVTNTTDDDIVTVGGSARYETKLDSRQKGSKGYEYYPTYDSDVYGDDLASFDSFPFGTNLDDPEISNDIMKKSLPKVPLGVPGFEFPELPPFKKASINATGFKTLKTRPRKVSSRHDSSKKFSSSEKENLGIPLHIKNTSNERQGHSEFPFGTFDSLEAPWDAKKTTGFQLLDFHTNFNAVNSRPKYPPYSKEPEETPEISKSAYYYEDAYLPHETREYDDFYDDADDAGFQNVPERAYSPLPTKNVHFTDEPISLAPKVEAPQVPRKSYTSLPQRPKPITNQVATSFNKISNGYGAGHGNDEQKLNVPEYKYPKSVTTPEKSPNLHAQPHPSITAAIPLGSVNYHPERTIISAKPLNEIYSIDDDFLYKNHKLVNGKLQPGIFVTSSGTRKQSNHWADDNILKSSSSSINKHRPTQVLSFLDEAREIEPNTGLSYAVNEGFDPATIVFENDFKPVPMKVTSNELSSSFQVSSFNNEEMHGPVLLLGSSASHQDSRVGKPPKRPEVLSKYYAEVLQQPPQTIIITNAKPSFMNQREFHDNDKIIYRSNPSRRPPLPAFKLRPPPDNFYKTFAKRMLPDSESSAENNTEPEVNTSTSQTNTFNMPSAREKRSLFKANDDPSTWLPDNSSTLSIFRAFHPQTRGPQNVYRSNQHPLPPQNNNNPGSLKYFSKKNHPPPAVQKRLLPESTVYNNDLKGGKKIFPQGDISERKLTPTQTTHLIILKDVWDNLTDKKTYV